MSRQEGRDGCAGTHIHTAHIRTNAHDHTHTHIDLHTHTHTLTQTQTHTHTHTHKQTLRTQTYMCTQHIRTQINAQSTHQPTYTTHRCTTPAQNTHKHNTHNTHTHTQTNTHTLRISSLTPWSPCHLYRLELSLEPFSFLLNLLFSSKSKAERRQSLFFISERAQTYQFRNWTMKENFHFHQAWNLGIQQDISCVSFLVCLEYFLWWICFLECLCTACASSH